MYRYICRTRTACAYRITDSGRTRTKAVNYASRGYQRISNGCVGTGPGTAYRGARQCRIAAHADVRVARY